MFVSRVECGRTRDASKGPAPVSRLASPQSFFGVNRGGPHVIIPDFCLMLSTLRFIGQHPQSRALGEFPV